MVLDYTTTYSNFKRTVQPHMKLRVMNMETIL